jgi:hypothetical protein
MRTTRRALCAASIAIASLLALSCNNDFGIFQSVQNEKKQVGTKVFQETPVFNAFRLGSYYFASTAVLNRRSVGASGDNPWSTVSIGGTPYRLRSAVLAGAVSGTPTIYTLIETGSEPNISLLVYSSTNGVDWTPITTLPSQTYTGSTISSLDALFATSNGELYAEGHSYASNASSTITAGSSTYTLYHLVGSSLNNIVTGFTPTLDKSIRGVVYDSVNTKYWIASEDQLVSNTAADGTGALVNEISTTYTGLAGKTIWEISYTSGIGAAGALYITTKDGWLFQGGTATGKSVTSIPLTQVGQVPTSSGSVDNILVGTDAILTTPAVGYFEGTFGTLNAGSGGTVTNNSSVYATTVGAAPVHAFYYDPTDKKLFICVSPGTTSTSYYGLYESDWTGSAWSGWAAQ